MLSLETCAKCHGSGRLVERVCLCAARRVFRACLRQYREIRAAEARFGAIDVDHIRREWKHRGAMYSRRDVEFAADFELVAQRALNQRDWAIFELFFLWSQDWKHCTAKLNLDRGTFFHRLYRIEEIVGRAYKETRPYPLYPVRDYFCNWQAAA